MAVLTIAAFLSKYNSIFADNTTRAISEEDMRDFRQDIADSFQSVLGATTITSWKSPCVVATTANISLTGEQTIDGVLTSASRVLVKNQTSTLQNGIYVSAAGAWSRSTDADSAAELEGAAVSVTQGTTLQNTIWIQTTDNITLETSAIAWQQAGYSIAGIGGSTGSTDNAVLIADGTGGSTMQASSATIADTGHLTIGLSDSGVGVINGLTVTRTTSVAPIVGIGATVLRGIVETSAGNNEIGLVIELVTTDITAGSEDFDLVFKLMLAGASAAEALRIKADKSTVFAGPSVLKSYTVATVPTASSFTGGMIYVTDEAGGAIPAFSDGTDWRRVTDRAVIS